MPNLDETSLKIHFDENDQIWYVDHQGPITDSKMTFYEFKDTNIFKNSKYIRAIGTHENTKYIVMMYGLKKTGLLKSLQVCSPLVCINNNDRNNPETALLEMRRWGWPSSIGGFHETTIDDYYQYLLAHEMFKIGGEFNDNVNRLVQLHPAWPALSFIPHLDIAKAAKLLALIIDPRWYIDFNEPNSGSKMKAYLGLTPKTQGFVSGESGFSHGIHPERCRLVMETWKTTKAPPENQFLQHPAYFLWRLQVSNDRAYEGDLRASQRFISFLRHTWTNELYKDRAVATEPLFIPKYFFKLPEEVEHYEKHIDNLSSEDK